MNVETILAYGLKGARDEQIAAFFDSVANKQLPIILMGDFNEPSHLDWTSRASNNFDHQGLSVPWPITSLLEENGFIDAYRDFFPDELLNPGITWPSYAHGVKSTSWTPLADERDRIDYVFYKGKEITTSYAALVGPKASYVLNQMDTTQIENENFMAETLQWPSDHKAVFVSLSYKGNVTN